MHQSDRVKLQFGHLQEILDDPQCLQEHHKMILITSRIYTYTKLYNDEQYCWLQQDIFTLVGNQIQEETKLPEEYMQWYQSLPFRYTSYKQFLIDPVNIIMPLTRQVDLNNITKPSNNNNLITHTIPKLPFPNSSNNKLLTPLIPNNKLQPHTFTNNKLLTPNIPHLTPNQITTTRRNTNRHPFVQPYNSHLSHHQNLIPLTPNITFQPLTFNHPSPFIFQPCASQTHTHNPISMLTWILMSMITI